MRISTEVLLELAPQEIPITPEWEIVEEAAETELENLENENLDLEQAVAQALAPAVKNKLSAKDRTRGILDQTGGSPEDVARLYVSAMTNAPDINIRFKALQDVARIQEILTPPAQQPINAVQITVMSDTVNLANVLNPQR